MANAQKVPSWIFQKIEGIAGEFLQPSEISNATLRNGDLLEAFYSHFAPSGYKCPYGLAAVWQQLESFRQWQRGTFDCEHWCDRQDGGEEVEDMFNLLDGWANDYLLPCHYIGATEGDGACFGIWLSWSSLEDAIKYEFEDTDDKETKVCGRDRVTINERGNVTYYRNGKELFSYV